MMEQKLFKIYLGYDKYKKAFTANSIELLVLKDTPQCLTIISASDKDKATRGDRIFKRDIGVVQHTYGDNMECVCYESAVASKINLMYSAIFDAYSKEIEKLDSKRQCLMAWQEARGENNG